MKKLYLFLSLLLSTCIYAAPADGPFPLPGGDIPPGGTLYITFSGLPKTTYYDVHCELLNPNYQKRYPIVVSFYFAATYPASASLNGQPLVKYTTTYQGSLNQSSNLFDATQYYAGPGTGMPSMLVITNFDNSDTVTVQNCYAQYSSPEKLNK